LSTAKLPSHQNPRTSGVPDIEEIKPTQFAGRLQSGCAHFAVAHGEGETALLEIVRRRGVLVATGSVAYSDTAVGPHE
jgi:hypothetical protein